MLSMECDNATHRQRRSMECDFLIEFEVPTMLPYMIHYSTRRVNHSSTCGLGKGGRAVCGWAVCGWAVRGWAGVDTGAWMGCVWTVNKGRSDVTRLSWYWSAWMQSPGSSGVVSDDVLLGEVGTSEPSTISNIAVAVGVMEAISWF
ncbi:LOW QUALITY PROTEIN: hypothetical protein HID58_017626 [Brassica napus]|uniref:Uncharacterized protein n=1 Tax=Brassica napus TaxID=3708 RepID=A0ABQ8D7M4_BRANA|nr:LOW QUALITY PROTEIN: hypothetical protein HID58_017626 [Brassica napus]